MRICPKCKRAPLDPKVSIYIARSKYRGPLELTIMFKSGILPESALALANELRRFAQAVKDEKKP